MSEDLHSLYVVGISDELSPTDTMKALRRAMDAIGGDATLLSAHRVRSEFERDGYASIVQAAELEAVEGAAARLRAEGISTMIDPDVERLARNVRAGRHAAEGKTPEQVFAIEAPGDPEAPSPLSEEGYRAALTLIHHHEGNPLRAAASAMELARATGDHEVYSDAITAIIRQWPQTVEPLRAFGLTINDDT